MLSRPPRVRGTPGVGVGHGGYLCEPFSGPPSSRAHSSSVEG